MIDHTADVAAWMAANPFWVTVGAFGVFIAAGGYLAHWVNSWGAPAGYVSESTRRRVRLEAGRCTEDYQEVSGEIMPWEVIGYVEDRPGRGKRFWCCEHVWGHRTRARAVRAAEWDSLRGEACAEEECGVGW